jgi:hypothetical protein
VTVWPPGTDVRLRTGPGQTTVALVLAVTIRGPGVSYEVVWWSGPDRKTACVEADEIAGPADRDAAPQRIGFGTEHSGV